MVWISDIWVYFLNENDIERGYLEYGSDCLVFECNEYSVEIPRVFTRVGLLREYIQICGDKKLINLANKLSDQQLRIVYHRDYSCNYESDNIYSQWIPYGKNKLFNYAEEWCLLNNFRCSKKECNKFEKYVYLDCL